MDDGIDQRADPAELAAVRGHGAYGLLGFMTDPHGASMVVTSSSTAAGTGTTGLGQGRETGSMGSG